MHLTLARHAGLVSALALVAGCATTSAPPAAAPPGGGAPTPTPSQAPRESATGPTTPSPAAAGPADDRDAAWRALVLDAPLAPRRLNFFHSALEVPPLRSARLLPCGATQLTVATTHARSRSEGDADGQPQDFDGTFHEWVSLEADRAVTPDVEIGGRVVLAGWDESQDRFRVRDGSGDVIVAGEVTHGEATSRHMNVSVVGLRGRVRLRDGGGEDWDLALAPSVKVPIGRDRDLTHGGTLDTALTLLATLPLDGCTLHANLGGTVPWTDNNLFVDEADVDLDPFLHAGVGVTVPLDANWSFATQIEGNTSAFGDLDFLDEAPVTWVVGARHAIERRTIEVAVGTALDHDAGYQFLFHVSIGFVF